MLITVSITSGPQNLSVVMASPTSVHLIWLCTDPGVILSTEPGARPSTDPGVRPSTDPGVRPSTGPEVIPFADSGLLVGVAVIAIVLLLVAVTLLHT